MIIFKQEDKALKGFKAVRWMIEQAQEFRNETLEADKDEKQYYNSVKSVCSEFKGSLPWHMADSIRELIDHGYRAKDYALCINWFSDDGKKHHNVIARFGKYNSSRNQIKFFYNVDHYDKTVQHLFT